MSVIALPCPFCGKSPKLSRHRVISCLECEHAPSVVGENPKHATEVWNRRAFQTVLWIPTCVPPGDDTTVLVAFADGEVCTGYHTFGVWRSTEGAAFNGEPAHWMHLPAAPEPKEITA